MAEEDLRERIWIDRNDIANVSEASQVDPDYVEYIRADLFAAALAQQREKFALACDAHRNKASINETEFDSIGEPELIPNVKYWEGQRVAATELAAAIRSLDKE